MRRAADRPVRKKKKKSIVIFVCFFFFLGGGGDYVTVQTRTSTVPTGHENSPLFTKKQEVAQQPHFFFFASASCSALRLKSAMSSRTACVT